MLLLLVILVGCSSGNPELDRGLRLRDRLLNGDGCEFSAEITADYGNALQVFSLDCQGDGMGNLRFTVTAPETISGITGSVSDSGGALTFEETALQFPLLADGQVTPVTAPWIFLKTLRSGCMTSAGMEGDLLRLSIDDSYEEDALHLDIWLNGEDIPVRSEILYDGRKILSLDIKNFVLV